jgi:hypothetical protein
MAQISAGTLAGTRYPLFLAATLPRKTTPRVKDGRVRRKNRTAVTAPDGYTLGASLQILRHAPGPAASTSVAGL